MDYSEKNKVLNSMFNEVHTGAPTPYPLNKNNWLID